MNIMSNINNEFCYEYFNCQEFDCSRRKNLDLNCWDMDELQCKTHSKYFEKLQEQLGTKQEACKFCDYYQNNK